MGFFEIFGAALAGFFSLLPSYGLAIILLTLTVRLVLLPLSIKQTRSMREMQVIQPEIKRIQQKHKGDRQKMNEEMMALYKEHGVNPFGGCFPLLAQFPVLIALFYVVRSPLNYIDNATQLAQRVIEAPLEVNRFLGLRLDCFPSDVLAGERSDFMKERLAELPELRDAACGDGFVSFLPYLLLIGVMGFTTWYQQKQMQANRGSNDNPQAAQMQMFARIMPPMLMFFAFNFPTGVVIYWVTTNLWTIVQQRIILRAAPPIADAKAGAGKSGGKTIEAKATPADKGAVAGKSGAGKNQTGKGQPSRNKKKKR